MSLRKYYPSQSDAIDAFALYYGIRLLERLGYDPEDETEHAVNDLVGSMVIDELNRRFEAKEICLHQDRKGYYFLGDDIP